MRLVSDAILNFPELRHLSYPALIGGLSDVHKASLVSALARRENVPAVVVCPDELAAKRLFSDISQDLGEHAVLMPAREFIFHDIESASRDSERERMAVLASLVSKKAKVVVAAIDALMTRIPTPEIFLSGAFALKCGSDYDMTDVIRRLVGTGYKQSSMVEGPGQFSRRGGIVDFFSPSDRYPVRADFFGDTVDTLSFFDPSTQRSVEQLRSAKIIPATETLFRLVPGGESAFLKKLSALLETKAVSEHPAVCKTIAEDLEKIASGAPFAAFDRYMPLIYDRFATVFDFLPENTLVFLDDFARLREAAGVFSWRMGEDISRLLENGILSPHNSSFAIEYGEFFGIANKHKVITMDLFPGRDYDPRPAFFAQLPVKKLPPYGGSLDVFLSDMRLYLSGGYRAVLLAGDMDRCRKMADNLTENGLQVYARAQLKALPDEGKAVVTVGALSSGLEYPDLKIVCIAESQIVAERAKKTRPRKKSARESVKSYADLNVGDLVVHEHHGIGRFCGIERMQTGEIERDYIKIAFAGTDFLYVPATSLDLVSKYIGAGENSPVSLSRLGGTAWQTAKAKAKGAATDLAKKLIALYAERKREPGYAFPPDDAIQAQFEQSFEYEETEDQLICAEEIKCDMCKSFPMDRLLCGDVGFGKTEVAFRAAMKCVLAGKQAAILVPTTVLCRQHYLTARKRFSEYPVDVAELSRFVTARHQKDNIRRIEDGSVDLVVGTHRLLQKDIRFSSLGLLIVDEEQRFGVSHKEKIKELSRQIDVLTLTATPIPRTLNMALSGIRDMSVLEDAPRDRRPVSTYVLEQNTAIIDDAIRRELARGGQVYYVHNRIETIGKTAFDLKSRIPDAEIAAVHGRLPEDELSAAMQRMSEGEIDVLVCTTIIENGVDISNVNTLIVEDADYFGLSQLHQLRGRVGRGKRLAYAYLTYRPGKSLSEIAQKRLSAIREFVEFGSGFKIAMRDLEIRGAGNVLGPEQSGHMLSVGYDLYLKLLENAVLEEKGEARPDRVSCAVDLTVSANIPAGYVSENGERMDLYRRIAMIGCREAAVDLEAEISDRYGKLPAPVKALILIALLRADAEKLNISDISQKDGRIIFTFKESDASILTRPFTDSRYRGKLLLNAGETPYLSLTLGPRDTPLEEASRLLEILSRHP